MLRRKGICKLIQFSSSTFVTTQFYGGGSFPSRCFSSRSDSSRRFAALWGNGDYGRLGLGSLESKWRPAICSFLDDDDIPLSIACGGAHTLFLTEKGRVFSSGFNNFGQLGTQPGTTHILEPLEIVGFPTSVVKISAGYYHSAAITEDGKLFMWGRNSSGQLGLGKKSSNIVSKPARVDSLVEFHIEGVALGSDHTIAITDKGQALSWGDGGSGKLGHGLQYGILGFPKGLREYMPRLIAHFGDVKITKIAAGLLHSACIDENGSVFVFGEPGFRNTDNTSNPSIVNDLPFSEDVACGGYHTCAVTHGGLHVWGSNENGCLGFRSSGIFKNPERIEGSVMNTSVSEVSCGWKHTAAICDGKVFTWGWGGTNGSFFEEEHSSGGQLGHGSDLDSFQPMMVNLGRNYKALQVSCGFNHTAAIVECT
ncbi:Regulator of chromosome condensation (RCC1) family protein [Zostera marina]|uniref:Regulator of chromosome condensation (RCC1) family protein n=1 Tax=Zostera marina TaxID=29655 RepID=A0A0K9P328_ZOSMR|nr:Regulator of chromosome condensation (RCC1) family protein [Zostera marina]